jgi:hypothetical protein
MVELTVPTAPEALYGKGGPVKELGNVKLAQAEAKFDPKKAYRNGEYATTADEHADDVRRFGMVKGDPNSPALQELLKKLPADIERMPDEGGLIMLRMKPAKKEDLIS